MLCRANSGLVYKVATVQHAGPLAQSAERRADNAKVVSSSLTWTTFFFIHQLWMVAL